MRINQNVNCCDVEKYSIELKERVEKVFEYSCQISKLKELLTQIKNESVNLRKLFLTEQEQKQKIQSINCFDQRIKSMIYCTLQNMQKYQLFGWKELIYDGDINDETVN